MQTVVFFSVSQDQSQKHHLLQILLSAWMTVSIFWIRRQSREAKLKCLSCPVSMQLTQWWNFTFFFLIVPLNPRPIHSSFTEKLIAQERHPAPESPTKYLITWTYLDKQILLRAAQWTKPYFHSFVTCDWACCVSCWVFVGKDTHKFFSFHGSGFDETYRWAFGRSPPLSKLSEFKWGFQNLLLVEDQESRPSDW